MYRLSRAGLRAVSLVASTPTRCQTASLIRPFSSFISKPQQHARPSLLSITRVRTYAQSAEEDQQESAAAAEAADAADAEAQADALAETSAEPAIETSAEPALEPEAEPATEQASAVDANDPPTDQIPPNSSVYVGNIFFETSETTLREEFGRYGEILRIAMPLNDRGLPRGIAYVTFKNTDDAVRAVEGMNRAVVEGRTLMVQFSRRRMATSNKRDANGRGISPPSRTLFVGNLAHEMTDADLNSLFRDLENVLDVRVAIDRRTGAPRGFAHADFTDEASATKAREVLEGREFYGRRVFVDFGKHTPPPGRR